jgi:hypothetical protein
VTDRLKSKYVFLLASLFASATVCLQSVPGLAQASGQPVKKSIVAKGKVVKSNSVTASEGVQLIEEIFQKLRNVPQLALAKSKQLLAFQNAPIQQQSWGSADSNLIIKPAQSNLAKPMSAPTSALAEKAAMSNLKGNNITIADAAMPVGGSAGVRARVVWEQGRQQQRSPMATDKEDEQDLGLSQAKNIATYGGRADQSGSVVSNAPLIKEFREQSSTSSNAIAGGATLQGAPVTKMKVAQVNLDDAIRRARSPAFRQLAKTLSGANLPEMSVRIQTTPSRVQQQFSEAKSLEPAPASPGNAGNSAQMVSARGTLSGFNPGMAPQAMDSLSAVPQVLDARMAMSAKKSESVRQKSVRSSYQLKAKDAREEIALLPLTKFSGIPLVNLGDSDGDLSKRLASAGTVEITMVKPWTVWSVRKHGSQECGLQVFSQKGVVEAVRVQDKSIWTNQQGIILGDEVSVVKEKFGEPAFILSHPIPSGNKIYVYPISQVAFRLERSAETDPPRIKDIIIFNVK